MLSLANKPHTSRRGLTASVALHVAAVAALLLFDVGDSAPRPVATDRATIVRPAGLQEPDLRFLRRSRPPRPAPHPRAELVAAPAARDAPAPQPVAPHAAAAPDIAKLLQPATLKPPPQAMPSEPPASAPPRLEVEFQAFETRTPRSRPETVPATAAGFEVASISAAVAKPRLPARTAGFSAGRSRSASLASRAPATAAGFSGAAAATIAQAERPAAAGSGFGRAAAAAAPPARDDDSGPIENAGFSGAVAGRSKTTEKQVATPAAAQPPKILDKPRPAYTEAARAGGVEGDALLEVLLGKSGQARVLRVIEGLGFGLDECAVEAASRVRFEPALRDGRPVDAVVTMRIRFQLAL